VSETRRPIRCVAGNLPDLVAVFARTSQHDDRHGCDPRRAATTLVDVIRAAHEKPPHRGAAQFRRGVRRHRGFPRLQGLFIAHMTGNFVTLGATLALGTHGGHSAIRTETSAVTTIHLLTCFIILASFCQVYIV
jgi:hypothetical protein